MQKIKKNTTPASFQQYCKGNQKGSYKDFSENEINKEAFFELRTSLVEEQNNLCAYCQQEIRIERQKLPKMKTEHFLAKNPDCSPELQLDYFNLIAVCLGNSNSKKENHCDSSKGHQSLIKLQNPASAGFQPLFGYSIRSKQGEVLVKPIDDNKDLKYDIEKILNLNEQGLRSKRFSRFKQILRKHKIEWKGEIPMNRKNIRAIKEIVTESNEDNKKLEFSGFINQYLSKRFKNEISEK